MIGRRLIAHEIVEDPQAALNAFTPAFEALEAAKTSREKGAACKASETTVRASHGSR